MKFPLLTRALATAAVALAILVPIGLIANKVAERQARAQSVVSQFAAETSGPQLIVGPLLALTCEETFVEERQVMRGGKAETVAEKKTTPCPTTYFSPRTLKVSTSLPVETRHRGIYSIRLYRAEVEIAGALEWPAEAAANGFNARRWKDAYVVTYVRDPRGVKAINSSLSSELLVGPGAPGLEKFSVREHLGPYDTTRAGSAIPFNYKLSVVGTSSFAIAPTGDQSEIRMRSTWPHPSFATDWSPDQRSVGAEGFEATWKMTNVATGGQAAWNRIASGDKLTTAPGAGVSLFDPVNVYSLSYRATQYAFLFVLFTFAALALTEVVAGVRLHPIQYALVGSAIAVFFLLLLALSEHLTFALSYGAAASACVLLLTFYLRHPLGTAMRTATFFGIFTMLYGSLYVLLQREDHALLMGSIMVFFTLAVAMIATRKVDWSGVSARMLAGRAAETILPA